MIVEDERDTPHDHVYDRISQSESTRPDATRSGDLSVFIRNYRTMQDSENHFALRDDLIAHLWTRKGQLEEDISEEEEPLPYPDNSSELDEEVLLDDHSLVSHF
ncbi:uncharacterized protein PGTG_21757 [Puccinia graminis f. sp. tritici CRL 75-36-700-3]|uniref:Uncharacterized protein n=1 Tax=Puccinia graminis f. sp. tritici (strain CRL 75-36-700-3 / race SCCL) TaxID=418459 RepID=H6QSE0_PUCGT|nr:uncharacterized protein PGTG_21757 [Puccinia graminis f. sp. tritici CRL 75-36-700-3]EHS63671.1 hypothetical protein PGTG_21757 [Puccinia graminis f. sp. tritici CRL 75-36-700-3]